MVDVTTSPSGPVAWFVSNPVAANLIMFVVLGLGFVSANSLPRETFPGLPPSMVTIEFGFPSGSPQITEQAAVLSIERALEGAPGVKHIRSLVRADGATITVEKLADGDLDELLAEVKARVDAIPNLPERLEGPSIQKARRDERVAWLHVSGSVGRDTLQTFANRIRSHLLQHQVINRVDRVGYLDPEIHVELDEAALTEFGLTLEDVVLVLGEESFLDLSGRLRSGDGFSLIRASEQKFWATSFEKIPVVSAPDGGERLLGELADVQSAYFDHQQSWLRFEGHPSIGLRVFKGPGASEDEVSQVLRSVAEDLSARGMVPEGVTLEVWNDRSLQVSARIGLLRDNALMGFLLVFGFLALTLHPGVAVWVALGLPFAFSGAFLVMQWAGLSLNDLTAFGLIVALGIVVDDAVVIGESVFHTKSKEGDSLESTVRGVHRVAMPTIFGVLTTVIGFLVLGLVKGEFGLVFTQFGLVTAGCLLFSLLESKLILPAHLSHLRLGKGNGSWMSRKLSPIQGWISAGFAHLELIYRRVLCLSLRRRIWAVATVGLVTLGGLFTVFSGVVKSSFFPDLPGELITATVEMEDTEGFAETEKHLESLEASLKETVVKLGAESLVGSVQVELLNDLSGQVRAEIRPGSQVVRPQEVASTWRDLAGELQGAKRLSFSADFDAFPAITLRLEAADEVSLEAAHAEILEGLLEVPGVRDVRHSLGKLKSEVTLRLTPEGRALGLSQADLSGQIQRAFLGYEVQRFQRGDDEVKVRVRYPTGARERFADLQRARVRLPGGEVVPLLAVADADVRMLPVEIQRVNGSRVSTISTDVKRDLVSPEAVMASLESDLIPAVMERYPGLTLVEDGELAEMAETSASMAWVLLLALTTVYALIAVPLKSYIQPILIMAVIPFGVLGAIAGHWIHDLPMSILSFFGLMALSGIVVNDSLLLVATFNEARARGEGRIDAWISAGTSRLRAVVLTSVTTFAGLAPLVLEQSEAAQYLVPAAVSIAYGVLATTVVTLVVLPLLHVVGGDLGGGLRRLSTWGAKA